MGRLKFSDRDIGGIPTKLQGHVIEVIGKSLIASNPMKHPTYVLKAL